MNMFWKCYRIVFITTDQKFKNVQFFRGFTWEVIEMAAKEAKEMSEKEKLKWAVERIERIY